MATGYLCGYFCGKGGGIEKVREDPLENCLANDTVGRFRIGSNKLSNIFLSQATYCPFHPTLIYQQYKFCFLQF